MGMVANTSHQIGRIRSATPRTMITQPEDLPLHAPILWIQGQPGNFPSRSQLLYKSHEAVLKDFGCPRPATLVGDGQVEVSGIASCNRRRPATWCSSKMQNFPQALGFASAAAVIAGEFAANECSRKPLLIAAQPRLAFARAAVCFVARRSGSRHPSQRGGACRRQLGKNVNVAERAVIREQVSRSAKGPDRSRLRDRSGGHDRQ